MKFHESDRVYLVFQEDILSDDYRYSLDYKNEILEKSIDSITFRTVYEYETEIWKRGKYIGGFVSSTYVYPLSELDNMETHFLSYIAGHNFEEFISPNLRYERNYNYNFPQKKHRTYDIYINDTINNGLSFSILEKNKIIFTSIITKEKFDIEIEKFLKKIDNL